MKFVRRHGPDLKSIDMQSHRVIFFAMLFQGARRLVFGLAGLIFATTASLHGQTVLIDKRITVLPIEVRYDNGSNGTHSSLIQYFEAETDKIWAQAGIDVMFLPRIYYNETDVLNIRTTTGLGGLVNELTDLKAINNGSGSADWRTSGNGGSYYADTVVRMFLTQTINGGSSVYAYALQSAFYGVGVGQNQEVYMAVAQSVFTFNSNNGRRDTIAHELGHLLSLDHTTLGASGGNNLLTDGGARNSPASVANIYPSGLDYSQLTGSLAATTPGDDFGTPGFQIDRARHMPMAVALPVGQQYYYDYSAIPEPGQFSAAAAALALFGVLLVRSRSTKASASSGKDAAS